MKGDKAIDRLEQLLGEKELVRAARLLHILKTHAPDRDEVKSLQHFYMTLFKEMYANLPGYKTSQSVEKTLTELEHDNNLLTNALIKTKEITNSKLTDGEKDRQIITVHDEAMEQLKHTFHTYPGLIEQVAADIEKLRGTVFETFTPLYLARLDKLNDFYQPNKT